MACNWLPHNLCEVAQAIYDVMDGKEPMLPGPDFPTGGIIINKNDIPTIMKTGKGSVKVRGKYTFENFNIVFTEIPYGIATEDLMNKIGEVCDNGTIEGITNIRNESNKKGFRLVIECEKNSNLNRIINQLFKETDLQTSISYNQVALIDKTPTELNLKKCIEIYIKHNVDCLIREINYDLAKAKDKLEIVEGLLKALEDIDNIIALIKKSESSADARVKLMNTYNFTENQAKAIVEMRLGKLAGLERIEIQKEREDLLNSIEEYNTMLQKPIAVVRERLGELVKTYGDARRTELTQLADTTKEEKEIQFVEPEKCVVVLTESGNVKRVPVTSFRTQKRNGKGVKTQDDITQAIIRTNTIDSLMIFSNQGKMYRLLVNDIPVGNNTTKGQPIKALVSMEDNEIPTTIYSIYRDTDAKYVLFTTKNGLVKKTSLEEYNKTRKKSGVSAIGLKDGDSIASVNLVKDEDIILLTAEGMAIRINSNEIGATSRTAMGVKGINLKEGDSIVACLTVRDTSDDIAVFSTSGLGKRLKLAELPRQKRGGKGLMCYKGSVCSGALVNDTDSVLICGKSKSICINCNELPVLGRASIGNQIIKDENIISISKV